MEASEAICKSIIRKEEEFKMEKRKSMKKRENGVEGIERIKRGGLAILAIALGIGGGMLISLFFGKQLKAMFPNDYVFEFVTQFILALIGLAILFLFRKQRVLRYSAEGMREGLICGMAWIIVPITAILGLVFDAFNVSGLTWIKGWEMTFLFLQCLLIGLFEECLFRGVVLELSFDAFGAGNGKQARMAIVFGAFLFGALHLINALQPEITLTAAAMQAVSVFGLGLVFGAIFYRSGRSIWPCVILHAIQDASAFVSSGTLYGVTKEEAVGSTNVSQVLYSLLFVVWFFYLTRDRQEEEA